MFGKQLAILRRKRNLTQYELADKLGFSRGQLANYEQGKREPDYDTLQKIADFFEVSIDYLLGREKSIESASTDEKAFIKWAKDSQTGAFFSEILESEEAEIEELREIWEIMKKRRQK